MIFVRCKDVCVLCFQKNGFSWLGENDTQWEEKNVLSCPLGAQQCPYEPEHVLSDDVREVSVVCGG